MKEVIHSVGIDIGTSTTQLIFSRLTIQNKASHFAVPRIDIVEKAVIYKSDIYTTPLISNKVIDSDKILEIVKKEYEKAGMKTSNVNTGAVIITGDTARKENADEVLRVLSQLAGDFVVATAGPYLESVLSAKGAGTDLLSEEMRLVIANLDIGGGTTNIAVFERGKLLEATCLDIGGRLIKINDGKISYIYKTVKNLAESANISLEIGEKADLIKLNKICELMADELFSALNLRGRSKFHSELYTNFGKSISVKVPSITLSGGVADCIFSEDKEDFRYSDIGVLLGRAIRNHPLFKDVKVFNAKETIRATVVGAGTHTTMVSGSTINYDVEKLPIKNLPVLKIPIEAEKADIVSFVECQLGFYQEEGTQVPIALSLTGNYHRSFEEIQTLAETLIKACDSLIYSEHPLVFVVESDIAKALGNAIRVRIKKELICIDAIGTSNKDYIDIGKPLAEGRVVPVVIKTLIFNS